MVSFQRRVVRHASSCFPEWRHCIASHSKLADGVGSDYIAATLRIGRPGATGMQRMNGCCAFTAWFFCTPVVRITLTGRSGNPDYNSDYYIDFDSGYSCDYTSDWKTVSGTGPSDRHSQRGHNMRALPCRWGNVGTVAPGPGAYDQSTLSMQKEVEKMTTNTARHGAFGMGERFAKAKQPDSAAVSHLMSQPVCADLFWSDCHSCCMAC